MGLVLLRWFLRKLFGPFLARLRMLGPGALVLLLVLMLSDSLNRLGFDLLRGSGNHRGIVLFEASLAVKGNLMLLKGLLLLKLEVVSFRFADQVRELQVLVFLH